MAVITFVLASLATYRLSRMLTNEEGPGLPWGTEEQRKLGAFTRMRGRFPPTNWIGRGLECIMCMSVWVALPLALYIDWSWTLPLTWLGLSGATVIIWKWEQKK